MPVVTHGVKKSRQQKAAETRKKQQQAPLNFAREIHRLEALLAKKENTLKDLDAGRKDLREDIRGLGAQMREFIHDNTPTLWNPDAAPASGKKTAKKTPSKKVAAKK